MKKKFFPTFSFILFSFLPLIAQDKDSNDKILPLSISVKSEISNLGRNFKGGNWRSLNANWELRICPDDQKWFFGFAAAEDEFYLAVQKGQIVKRTHEDKWKYGAGFGVQGDLEISKKLIFYLVVKINVMGTFELELENELVCKPLSNFHLFIGNRAIVGETRWVNPTAGWVYEF